MNARAFEFDELTVGQRAAFSQRITAEMVDQFAALSGDHNPLHTNAQFATDRQFSDRVVHGALLAALVSRLVGMELPGRNSFLLDLKLSFLKPTFPGDELQVSAEIKSLHPAERVVSLRVRIACGEEQRARGSAMVRVARGEA